ncbi:hypothetical protein JAAARDRAFT_29920 [Jaapia argillacea MUCL 33604]|uniref:Copper acquisition factor BIM1-like domain-containing protein n=1 Tax=Jaapia argillacea MUCL 33604 TaxID=933084 RepID=A0A067Q9Y3_9AGAM|nr:hypothetical protein JAAARDRAFT_29920 [Jaapia argillacea MUCL 33604]
MRLVFLTLISSLVALVHAHFQLQYPIPRGPFVEDSEPTFCDGYANVTANRTVFPLNSAFIELNSEHTSWIIGVIISTAQDPTSFNDFHDPKNSSAFYQVMPFNQQSGEGLFCLPINLGSFGIADGTNATIQVIFDGSDGILYQCADLTLSSSATVPTGTASGCKNLTVTSTAAALPTSTTFASSANAPQVSINMMGPVMLFGSMVLGMVLAFL